MQTQKLELKNVFEKDGVVEENVNALTTLIMGVGVATMVLIFVGVLGGQVYSQTQADIDNISDNVTKGYITDAIQSGFKALKTTGNYMPIVVLAVIIFVVLGLVLSLNRAGPSQGYGGAL